MSKAYNTIKAQTTAKGYLESFQNETGFKISFNNIDDHFFEELMKYSFFNKKIKNNYFSKIVAILKSFLNWSTEKGYNKNREYEKFKSKSHDVDIIYLTFAVLFIIYYLIKLENFVSQIMFWLKL